MAGEFTVTGFAAQRLADGVDAGTAEEQSPLEGLTGRFISNIPAGKPIPVPGGLLYVPPRDWIIDAEGQFREVRIDGTTSDVVGITLTADDPAFELGARLQWQIMPGKFTMLGGRGFRADRNFRLASWWFDAREPGWSGTIDELTPVPGVEQPGGTRGPRGFGITGNYLGASTDSAAMVTKVGVVGDWTIRTDTFSVWVITATPSSTEGNWLELAYPTGATAFARLLLGANNSGEAMAVLGDDAIRDAVELAAPDLVAAAVTADIAGRDLVETTDPRLFVITNTSQFPLVVKGQDQRIALFVDGQGHLWAKFQDGVAFPGGQLTASSVGVDKFDSTVTLPRPTSNAYPFSIKDASGRRSELTIDERGRLPQFSVDGIVSRASGAALGPAVRRYTLKLDGTGDFATLAAAVAALGPGTQRQPILLTLYPGTHSSFQVTIPDWWILRGANTRDLCRIHGENVDSATDAEITNNSTIQVNATTELHNLTVTGRNMRYAVHDESNGLVTDGTVTVKNCHFEHLGNAGARDWRTANPGSGMLASTVWATENAWGHGTSSGNKRKFFDSTFVSISNAWYVHDNKDFALPSEHELINCELITTYRLGTISINSLGAGQASRVSMLGCATSALAVEYGDSPWISLADDQQVANHSQIDFSDDSSDLLGFITSHRGKALKVESSSTTTSTVRVSGTAAAAVFGQATYRDGGAGLKGYIYSQWDISGILAGINSDTAVKNTLGKRLGDCSTVSKTLTVTVDGGTPINIVFSTNLMAVSNATIIGTINTALGAAATASEYLFTQGEVYPKFTSRTKRIVNRSATGIPRWAAVKLDTYRGVALMGTADAASLFYGVALEPIPPNAAGRILTSGLLQTASQMAGLSTSPVGGTAIYFSDSGAGQFSLSGTRQAATVQYETGWAAFIGARR